MKAKPNGLYRYVTGSKADAYDLEAIKAPFAARKLSDLYNEEFTAMPCITMMDNGKAKTVAFIAIADWLASKPGATEHVGKQMLNMVPRLVEIVQADEGVNK